MQPALAIHADDHRDLWFFDTLVNIRVAEADGDNGLSVLEHRARHGDSPPEHVHSDEDEVFHVLVGRVRMQLAGKRLDLGQGDTVIAPRGIPHTYRVESQEGGHFLTITCKGSFERFVRTIGRPAARLELPAPGTPPTPEQMQAVTDIARRCGIEFVGPPLS